MSQASGHFSAARTLRPLRSLRVALESGFLEGLPEDARSMLLSGSRRRRFARKEVIFHKDDPADSLHVLERGWVAVRVVTALGDVATLDIMGKGAIFGELALLPPTHGHRSATIVALEPSQTFEVPATLFTEVCEAFPSAVAQVLALMAARELRLTDRLIEALYLPVETRLVRRLIEVDRQYSEPQGRSGSIPLTQDDLASLAGTTRETANRVIRRLIDAGGIAAKHGSFEVLDREVLQKRARISPSGQPVL